MGENTTNALASTSSVASVSAPAPFPLPSEVIQRVFAVGEFSESDAAKLARVTKHGVWQECALQAMWSELEVKVCEARKHDPRLFVHKLKTQKKVKRLLKKPLERLRFVKRLTITIADTCEQAECRFRNPLDDLIGRFDVLVLNVPTQSYRRTVAAVLESVRACPPRAFLVYASSPNSHDPVREPDVSADLVRHWAHATGVPKQQIDKKKPNKRHGICISTVAVSIRGVVGSNYLRSSGSPLALLDLQTTTSLTLHGSWQWDGTLKTLRNLVALDFTLDPSYGYELRDFLDERTGPLAALQHMPSLRRLTIRVWRPYPLLLHNHSGYNSSGAGLGTVTHWDTLQRRLHSVYPPALEVLAFKSHTARPNPTQCSPAWLQSAEACAYHLIFKHSINDLCASLSRFFNLRVRVAPSLSWLWWTDPALRVQVLELPTVPYDKWAEATEIINARYEVARWRREPGHTLIMRRGAPTVPSDGEGE